MTDYWNTPEQEEFKPWSLADIYDDLGSLRDICQTLDVTEPRVRRWIERRERIRCPLPIKRIAVTDVYSMHEWKTWFKTWTDPERRGRRADSKWVNTRPHGSGENFFTYALTCPTCGHRDNLK